MTEAPADAPSGLSAARYRPDHHAEAVKSEMAWLSRCVTGRLTAFFEGRADFEPEPPPTLPPDSALGRLVASAPLDPEARLVLALALAPEVDPAVLDPFFVKNSAIDRVFSEFGAARSEAGRAEGAGFLPSAETALFLIGGADTGRRISAMALFRPDHPLRRFVGLAAGSEGMTLHGGPLAVPAHRIIALCTGQAPAPDFSARFPARRITTGLDWDGLILPGDLRQQLGHIAAWLENRRIILDDWGLSARIGPGFKALFYGPPGTGKSLTAAMLGKRTGLDVYRIDLAQVVSKYIGETEKNLGLVFDMAEERDWILFFDEADALFGTRASGASTANDRYANQEVAYLLQRIEDCPSLVILATNLKNNIDEAFFRRFQLALGFTRPDADLRRQLWTSILGRVPLAPDVDVDRLAREHPLVGGAIINIVRHATISALRRGSREVSADDIRQGIAGEMRKEGRTA